MSIQERMEKTVESTIKEWSKVRTGVANGSILDDVMVDYYGTPTPVTHLAAISTPEPRVLAIAPWEKPMLAEIEKAIYGSNLGLTPSNDGSLIRLTFPILTSERRQELAKQCRQIGEDAKIAIRNIRRDENDKTKKDGKEEGLSEDIIKDELEQIQKITDVFAKKIDELASEKEASIMKV